MRTIPTTPALLAPLLLAVFAVGASGCNIASTVAYAVQGPPKVQAVTSLDGERSHVIFVDDRANRISRRSLRVVIGQEAEETLIAEGVVPHQNMIASQSGARAAATSRYDEPMSIADIGRAVGADVVIYLTIDQWTLSTDGVSYSPRVVGRVKIIDAAERARIWPEDRRGHQFVVEPALKSTDRPSTRAARADAESELARRVGRELAGLFYDRQRPGVREG